MMGSVSIVLSVPALWRCWLRFARGKKRTPELEHFRFHIEKNLTTLHCELRDGTYRHGSYLSFCVNDTKTREIAVASIRDRFVHRLLYEHLVNIYDKTFIYDVWSCREEKGLLAAIERAQDFLAKNSNGFFWRGDVRKFFDSVDHATLLRILGRRINDDVTVRLLEKVIDSYTTNLSVVGAERERERERERVLLNLRARSPSAM